MSCPFLLPRHLALRACMLEHSEVVAAFPVLSFSLDSVPDTRKRREVTVLRNLLGHLMNRYYYTERNEGAAAETMATADSRTAVS